MNVVMLNDVDLNSIKFNEVHFCLQFGISCSLSL